MADFNIEMSPAQNAGANVINPVQVNPVQDNNFNGIIEKGASLFAGLAEGYQKQKAQDQRDSVVQQYQLEAGRIASLRAAGKIDPGTASTQDQALYYKYLTSYKGMSKELSEARKVLFEGTATGETQRLVDKQRAEETKMDELAASQGLDVYNSNNSQETRKKYWEYAQNIKRAELAGQRLTADQSRQIAANDEERNAYRFNQEVTKKRREEQASADVREITTSRYDAFSSFVMDRLRSAQTPEQIQIAQGEITKEMSTIQMAVSRLPDIVQEKMNMYLEPFKQLTNFSITNMKPGTKLEGMKQQLEELKAKSELLFRSDPETAATIDASRLLGHSPIIAATKATNAVIKAIPKVAQEMGLPLRMYPSIVGTEHESGVQDIITESARQYNNGNVKGKPEELSTELKNSIDTLTRQAQVIAQDHKDNPSDTFKHISFFATEDVGILAKKGVVAPETKETMKDVIVVYQETLMKSLNKALSETIPQSGVPGKEQTTSQYISNITFFGGKIVVIPKTGVQEIALARRVKGTMEKASDGLTTIIKAAAHADGRDDYKQYWEENKHILVPSFFKAPKEDKQQPSQVKVSTESQMKSAAVIKPNEVMPDTQSRESNLVEIDAEIKAAIKSGNKRAVELLQQERLKYLK